MAGCGTATSPNSGSSPLPRSTPPPTPSYSPEFSPAQLTRAQRWSNVIEAPHNDFSAGIFPDQAGHLIPDNGCFDAIDFIFDRRGIARKRGGTTAVFSGSQTAVGLQIGAMKSGAFDNLRSVYALGNVSTTINLYYLNTSTGAWTTILALTGGGTTMVTGRPFQHFNLLVFPQANLNGSTFAGPFFAGGATGAKAAASGTAATITANNDTITGITGINASTQVEIGEFIYCIATAGTPQPAYVGRVTAIPSSSSVRVDPTPSASFTAVGVQTSAEFDFQHNTIGNALGGQVGCSWQNRIILGNVYDWSRGSPGFFPRRTIFSILPNETGTQNGSLAPDGLVQTLRTGFEPNNYFDLPDAPDPINAYVPFGFNKLLIFSATDAHQVTGTLTTQTATSGGQTWDPQQLPYAVGCLTDRSIQRTPRGVVFASQEGVFITDGSTFKPLMEGKVANQWQDGLYGGGHVVGSAYFRGHYFVSTDGYGYLCNLSSLAWTRVFGPATRIFDSVPDPTNQNTIWGLRWFTGAAPSMTNGQAVRLESWFHPSSSNRADADTTTVSAALITKAYSEGALTSNKSFLRTHLSYSCPNGTVLVERTTGDPQDGPWTTIGTLAASATRTKQALAVGVARGPSVAYRFTTAACDSFTLYGITDLFMPESAGSDV